MGPVLSDVLVLFICARRIFSRTGQIRGLGTKIPSGVQGWNSGGGRSGGKAPRSRRQVVKIINNSPTECFAVTTDVQNTLQHFQPLLPMPAVAYGVILVIRLVAENFSCARKPCGSFFLYVNRFQLRRIVFSQLVDEIFHLSCLFSYRT